MKILQVTPCFYPSQGYGGTPRVVFELSKALTARGHQITVYTTDTLNPQKRIAYRQKKIDNLRVYYFKNVSNSLLSRIKLPITPGILRAKHFLKQFNLIHLHEYRTFQNIVIAHYARKYKIPYLVTPHGSLATHGKFTTAKKIFDFLFGKKILQRSSRILVLSKQVGRGAPRRALARHNHKIIQIKNGINLVEFKKSLPENLFRQKFKLGDSPFILFLGRINPIKGLDFLIDVFSKVSKELPQVKLVLAGPDENYRKKLENKIKEKKLGPKIIFTGPLSGKLKLSALREANPFVYPSRYEAFPLSPLEAIASKTPVIISDQCGIANLFSQKKLGPCLAYGNIKLWKEKILQILKNPNRAFCENAYQYLKNNLTWEKIAYNHEQIYQETLLGLSRLSFPRKREFRS